MKIPTFLFLILTIFIMIGCEAEKLHENILPLEPSFEYDIECMSVIFTNTSATDGDYQWNFGDGTISTEKNPIHTYDSEGSYMVTLTINNNALNKGVSTEVVAINFGNSFHREYQEGSIQTGRNIISTYDRRGYIILGRGGGASSYVHSYNKEGKFEQELYSCTDCETIAYLQPESNVIKIIDNKDGGIEVATYNENDLISVNRLFKSDTLIEANQALLTTTNNTVIIGKWSNKNTMQKGIFIWSDNTSFLPLGETTFVTMNSTDDGGFLVAAFVKGGGIYVAKYNRFNEQLWGDYLFKGPFGPAYDYSHAMAIKSISGDEYVVCLANSNISPEFFGRANSPTGEPYPNNIKGSLSGLIIKANRKSEIWKTTVNNITHLSSIVLNKNGHITASGGINGNDLLVPYLVQVDKDGHIIFEKTLLQERVYLNTMLEVEDGGFIMVGTKISVGQLSLKLIQTDCSGNL